MSQKLKVLLLMPRESSNGGVLHYTKMVKSTVNEVDFILHRRGKTARLSKVTRIPVGLFDYVLFVLKILYYRPNLVHQNTSLGRAGIVRDAFYVKVCLLFNLPLFLFIHGWNLDYEKQIDEDSEHLFRRLFLKASAISLLTESAVASIKRWNYSGQIHQATTSFDEGLIEGLDFSRKPVISKSQADTLELLFISRVEPAKGVFELLEAFRELQGEYPITLHIAGQGSALQRLKSMVEMWNLGDSVVFHGLVSGDKKRQLMFESDVFILPSYTEGLPISLLESLAFGMPAIVSAVGGIPRMFEDKRMGVLLENVTSESVKKGIKQLVLMPRDELKSIGSYNKKLAERYSTKEVMSNLPGLYLQAISFHNESRINGG